MMQKCAQKGSHGAVRGSLAEDIYGLSVNTAKKEVKEKWSDHCFVELNF